MKTYRNLDAAVDGIPSTWYHDPSIFQQELEAIWGKHWLYVCVEAQIPEPLDYLVYALGTQSVIILRDAGGIVRAYHNTCRHRGSALCLEQQGKLPGRTLICPYHNWSYDLSTGGLRKVPSSVPENFDPQAYGLFAVAVHNWRGLIFINPDQSPVPFEHTQVFQSYSSLFDDYPIEKLALGHHWQKTVACNWKIYWENYSECLHCPNVHPELSQLVPLFSRRLNSVQDIPGWEEKAHKSTNPKYTGGLRKGAETWSADGTTQGRAISGQHLPDGHSYSSTWPAMFCAIYADHMRIVRIHPIDAEHTELTAEYLFPPETLADPNYKRENITEFAELVMLQDATAAEWNQRGIRCSRLQQGVIMPEEYEIKAFHDWLRGCLSVDESLV